MGGFEFNGTVAYGYQVPYEAFKVGQNEEDADKVDSEWAQDYLPECWNLFCKFLTKATPQERIELEKIHCIFLCESRYDRCGLDQFVDDSSYVFGYPVNSGMRANEFLELPTGLKDKIAHFIYVLNETKVLPSIDEMWEGNKSHKLSILDAPTEGEPKKIIDSILNNIKDEGIVIGVD